MCVDEAEDASEGFRVEGSSFCCCVLLCLKGSFQGLRF